MREAARVLIRRKWLLIAAPLVSALVTGIVVVLQPARYAAEAIVSGGAQVPQESVTALATSDALAKRLSQLPAPTLSVADIAQLLREGTLEPVGGGLVRLVVTAPDPALAVAHARAWAETLVGLVAETYPQRTQGGPENTPRVVSGSEQATRLDARLGPKVVTASLMGLLIAVVAVLAVRFVDSGY